MKRRHIAAVTLGNALEFYDFLTYAFFAIQIGRAFFPSGSAYGSLMLSLATFGAGFVTRPLGGIVIGDYADRAGRKPAMLLCFLLIGASMLLMALIPPYSVIGAAAPILAVLARMMQGFSLGGEIGSNTAYLVETATPERRGLTASWQGASQNAAVLVGSLLGLALSALLSPAQLDAFGWRVAFLAGVSVVPFGLWMRSTLPETLDAPEPTDAAGESKRTDESRPALARRHARALALGFLVFGMGTIPTYVGNYIVTYAQNTLHLPPRAGFIAQSALTATAIPAGLLGGFLSDRFGRRPVNVSSALALLVLIYPVFLWIVTARSLLALTAGMALYGAASNACWGSFYAAFGETLPRSIRSSGLGTVYSLAIAGFGGTTQLVVTWIIHSTGDPLGPAWYALAATFVLVVALTLFPESAPVRLRSAA